MTSNQKRWWLVSAGLLAALLLASPATGQQPAGAGSQPAAAPDSFMKLFDGLEIGMSVDQVREIAGKPDEKDETMDLFQLSGTRRLRVYYGDDRHVQTIVSTFIGDKSGPPAPETVLGRPLQASETGSMSGSAQFPDLGYSIVYSRVGGEEPMVLLTLRKM